MTTNGVLALVDEVAYQSWQQHIIYEKNRARTVDEQSATGQDNGTTGADESANGQPHGPSDEQQYRREVNARQLELVAAVAAGPAVCSQYLLRHLRVTDEEALRSAVPPLPNPLTASELLRLPRYAEVRIAESLAGVSPAEAATPVFWAACHAVWIERGNFDDLVAGFLEGPHGHHQAVSVQQGGIIGHVGRPLRPACRQGVRSLSRRAARHRPSSLRRDRITLAARVSIVPSRVLIIVSAPPDTGHQSSRNRTHLGSGLMPTRSPDRATPSSPTSPCTRIS